MRIFFLFLTVFTLLSSSLLASEQVQKLQDISVTINTGHGQGSGVLFTRHIGDQDITFVWTAGHVVDSLRKTRSIIDPATGTEKKVIEFEDASIVREFTENGRRIGEMKLDARIVKFSDADNGEDLALLQVRKSNFSKDSAVFFLDDKIPEIGTELYHVGSLLGQVGANSLTTGVISQIGRTLPLGAKNVVFDQTTVTAFPGSSGGGVFEKENNKYVGMLVRGSGEQFNFIVPVRRLKAWAKKNSIEWAIDQNVPAPTLEQLNSITVEDAGVELKGNHSGSAENKKYPFLLQTNLTTLFNLLSH